MSKYYKLSKKDQKLKPTLEYNLIKLSSFGLLTFLITILAASALAPIQTTNADELLLATQATGGSISLTTSGNINLALETSSAGAVRTEQDTVSVTSSSTGYQLYLSTASKLNYLVRDGATATNTDPITYADLDLIPTGGGDDVSSPAPLSNDTWGFAILPPNSGTGSEDVVSNNFDPSYPTGDNSSPTSKFTKVPTKGNDILIARRSSLANSIPTYIYYGTRVTSAKPSGIYKTTITYTAISDSTTENLASVSPSRTSQINGGAVITIATPSTIVLDDIGDITATVGGQTCINPSAYKTEYALVNVTCTTPALSTGFHDVNVSFSGSGQSYTVSSGIEYYTETTTIATMQEFTSAKCNAMYPNQSTTLKDTRDGQVYKITKLPDGLCWMSENLRLGTTIMDAGSIEINSTTSDYSGTAFSITSDQIATASDTSSWTNNDYDAIHIYARPNTEKDVNGNTLGNLYNWYTATAKSGTYSMSSGNAVSSICPKNWKLPPNTGTGSYENLLQVSTSSGGLGLTQDYVKNTTVFGDTAIINKAPYYFPITNNYSSGYYSIGGGALYWLKTAQSNDNAYNFYFYGPLNSKNNGLYSSHGHYYKYLGYAVRCVVY